MYLHHFFMIQRVDSVNDFPGQTLLEILEYLRAVNYIEKGKRATLNKHLCNTDSAL